MVRARLCNSNQQRGFRQAAFAAVVLDYYCEDMKSLENDFYFDELTRENTVLKFLWGKKEN